MSDDFNYKVKDGRIVSPGKFQGEPEWIVTLWEMVLNGSADISLHDGTMEIAAFEIDKDMAALTGYESAPDTYVAVWADDRGFVSHMTMTRDQIDACEPSDLDSSDDDDYLDFVREEENLRSYQGLDN